jgi:hypothetical protein
VAGGFTSPSILYLSTWDAQERLFVRTLSERLRGKGFTRVAEPSAGAHVGPMLHRAVGWEPEQIETTSTDLYSAIVAYAAAGRDHHALNVCVDGEPIPLAGDPITDGALLLYWQLWLRTRQRPDSDYWRAMVYDLDHRRDKHITGLRDQLTRQVEALGPIGFEPMDPRLHFRRVADQSKTLVTSNLPTYEGAYEKFFDTKGRMTWNGPDYTVWSPERDQKALAEESQDWDACLLVQQQAEPGKAAGDVVYARHLSMGQYVYLWTNKPELLHDVMGRAAVPKTGELVKPMAHRAIPHDYEITEQSVVAVEQLDSSDARYYKELWLHKLTTAEAGWNLAVFIDGFLAGIAGVSRPTTATMHNQRGNLLLMYATAAPHKDRLTRLVTMLVMSRPVLDRIVEPFQMAQVEEVITAELTHHPEIKGLRGLMKLKTRKEDPTYGYRLIYCAPVTDSDPQAILNVWLGKEAKWRKSRATVA